MNRKRIVKRSGLRILTPILMLFVTRSRALADMAWDPSPGLDLADITPFQLIRFIIICIIVSVWLFAKGRMLKTYDGTGWPILVPFYGRYLEYKYYWDRKYYWINVCISVFTFWMWWFMPIYQRSRVFLMYGGLLGWVVITVLMRMKTLEAFGQKKLLWLLELLGLGFVLDCLCAFHTDGSKRKGN